MLAELVLFIIDVGPDGHIKCVWVYVIAVKHVQIQVFMQ
jgi:hypothetical protein